MPTHVAASNSILAHVDTQLKHLCSAPNSQSSDAISFFHRAVELGHIPSGSACNLLVKTLARKKEYNLVLEVYTRMTCAKISPNFLSLAALIECFVHSHKVGLAIGVMGMILKRGFRVNVYLGNVILKGLCQNNEVVKAMEVFRGFDKSCVHPDIVSFNTLIKAHCKARKLEEAFILKVEMEAANCAPNLVTYAILIDGLCEGNFVEPDDMTYNLLIQGLCKEGRLSEASNFHHKMVVNRKSGNIVTYNVLIGAYLKAGNVKKAIGMATLCKEGSLEQGVRLFEEMRNDNCEPDIISFNIIVDATLKTGNFLAAKEFLTDMLRRGLTPDAWTFGVLINRLSKQGQLEDAKSMFERMAGCGLTPDAFVYGSLLEGLSEKGETDELIKLLHHMAAEGVVLDSGLTSTILTCLCCIPEDLDIAEILPNFSKETPKGLSITCNELLKKLHNSHPELQLYGS
ncbi:hypothetical protein RJ639_017510 [Escallonia herrerae]|uniref:Pentatricopeptide repeat-containing protein n=1 Tax=Escallonia herrerae TaxID=1293975 RepID=A0AA89AKB2_9ASTE|nr:hypothetical protein RJ639_017510 [Escallonia herrerae]